MPKIYLLVFAMPLLLFSCAAPAPRENISAAASPSIPVSTVVSTTVVSTQHSSANLIPKHNDLIFVEFFAVT